MMAGDIKSNKINNQQTPAIITWGYVVLIGGYLVREHAKTDGKTSNNN